MRSPSKRRNLQRTATILAAAVVAALCPLVFEATPAYADVRDYPMNSMIQNRTNEFGVATSVPILQNWNYNAADEVPNDACTPSDPQVDDVFLCLPDVLNGNSHKYVPGGGQNLSSIPAGRTSPRYEDWDALWVPKYCKATIAKGVSTQALKMNKMVVDRRFSDTGVLVRQKGGTNLPDFRPPNGETYQIWLANFSATHTAAETAEVVAAIAAGYLAYEPILEVWDFDCEVPGTTPAGPAAPYFISAIEKTSTSIRLAWDPLDFSVLSVTRNGLPIAELPAGSSEYTDTGLNPNTSYTYTVRAFAPFGEYDESPPLIVTTNGTGGSPGTPNASNTDLNSDGVADLLSQYTNGDLYAYPGSGAIMTSVTNTTFGAQTDVGSWVGHTNLALGDINGDGKADLVSQTANGDIYAFRGSGSINTSTTFWSGTRVGSWLGHVNFALGDLNNDGKADLLSQTANGDMYVYRATGNVNGSSTFLSGIKIGNWAGHGNFALGDLNGDHKADLLSQTSNGNMYAYPGSGSVNASTTFWSGTMIGPWIGHTNYDLADFNGDGRADLLTRTGGGVFYAYPGSGSINPTTTFWSGTQLDPRDVANFALGDLNGDHIADELTQTPDGILHAYPGTGHITVTTTSNTTMLAGTNINSWAGHTNLTRADIDRDGNDDLLTQTANGDLYVYRGSGHISAATTFWSGLRIGNWAGHTNLALGDVTGDGIVDLVTQYNDGNLYVYPGSGHLNETNTFLAGTVINPWVGHDHFVLGDLNGDGTVDLLTQYQGNNLYVYPGSGHLSGPTTFLAGIMIGSWAGHVDFALGDINRDGKTDLVSQTIGGDLFAYPGTGTINPTTTFLSGTFIGPWVGHTNLTL